MNLACFSEQIQFLSTQITSDNYLFIYFIIKKICIAILKRTNIFKRIKCHCTSNDVVARIVNGEHQKVQAI